MRKQLMIPALLAASVALAACSTPPNPNLEQARTNYAGLQANPQASKIAALETKDAADWMDKAEGALALMILLDQYPRNSFRGTAHQFATDPLALMFAEQAVARGWHLRVEPELKNFLLLPFEHSERLEDQDRYLALVAGDAELEKWGRLHRDIIVRFGRFPHRNLALGRATTPEEQAFLDKGGFGG